jgi:hypothetical protein
MPSTGWVPVFRCCWCSAEFVLRTVDHVEAWTCPTKACFLRQLHWKMTDVDGRLFYLPLPRQVEVEEAIETQQWGAIGVGGHRNSGKSAMLRKICYRLCDRFEDFTILFLRRNFPELQLNHMKYAVKECKRIGAKFAVKQIDFPDTGSQIIWGHCYKTEDYKNYIGGDVDMIVFEQLEEFESIQFTEISASTGRTRGRKEWRGLVLAGENPGGPLSAFVEEFFIKKNPPPELYPDYDGTQYHFIATSLEDNPYADPRYVNNLATLSPARRQMFRFGRRDIFPLQYFKTFLRPDRVQALVVPSTTPRLCAMHWGFFKPGIFLWAVVLGDGRLYIEAEYTFLETVASEVARTIVQINRDRKLDIGAYVWGNAPGKVADDDIGEHTFETLFRHGLPVVPSTHDPINGWQRLQHWFEPMKVEDGEQAALIINPACVTLIRSIPQLLQDAHSAEDVDEVGATEGAKALRYLVMSRPEPPMMAPPPKGRDLSKLDPRVRGEIEYLARCEDQEAQQTASAYSLGEFWATDYEAEDRR